MFSVFSKLRNHDMTMTRRDFLSASAVLAAAPLLGARAWAAPLPRAADIVVIGAGVAGRAAARRIIATNRKVIVVEATDRIGGRCQTDSATFGVPFERGARWMGSPDTNPMIKLARNAGLDISTMPFGPKIRVGRRNARAGETEEFWPPWFAPTARSMRLRAAARAMCPARQFCQRTSATGRGPWNSCSAPTSPART